jgi:hypothetical protein
MSAPDPSLRLRPWVALVVFISAYAPLLLILAIKDLDVSGNLPVPKNPWWFGGLLVMAVLSCVVVLRTVGSVREGLQVQVSKAANKSGEMFGYTIPYVLSVVRIDLADWPTVASLLIFMGMMFVMAYRTQTVLVNPVLAMAGYMLIDATFKRGNRPLMIRPPDTDAKYCRFGSLPSTSAGTISSKLSVSCVE